MRGARPLLAEVIGTPKPVARAQVAAEGSEEKTQLGEEA